MSLKDDLRGKLVKEFGDDAETAAAIDAALGNLGGAFMLNVTALTAATAESIAAEGVPRGMALIIKAQFTAAPAPAEPKGGNLPQEIRLLTTEKPHEMDDLTLIAATCKADRPAGVVTEAETRYAELAFWAKSDDGVLHTTASQEAWQYGRDNQWHLPAEWDNIPLYTLRDALDKKRYAHPRTGKELPKGRGWGQVPIDKRILANLYFLTVDESEWADDASLIRDLTKMDEVQLAQDVRWGGVISLQKRSDTRSRRLKADAEDRLYVQEGQPGKGNVPFGQGAQRGAKPRYIGEKADQAALIEHIARNYTLPEIEDLIDRDIVLRGLGIPECTSPRQYAEWMVRRCVNGNVNLAAKLGWQPPSDPQLAHLSGPLQEELQKVQQVLSEFKTSMLRDASRTLIQWIESRRSADWGWSVDLNGLAQGLEAIEQASALRTGTLTPELALAIARLNLFMVEEGMLVRFTDLMTEQLDTKLWEIEQELRELQKRQSTGGIGISEVSRINNLADVLRSFGRNVPNDPLYSR